LSKYRKTLVALAYLLTIPIISIFYNLINHPRNGVNILITGLDKSIPFMKIFIIPYVSWYFFIFIVLVNLALKDKEIYYKTLISYNLGMLVCYLIYLVYQTTVPRPDITSNDILSKLVLLIYSNDNPYNCFPSIHSYTSYLMIKAILKSNIRNMHNTLIISSISILIILSTLFVKQHVVLDAISAIILGEIIFNIVYRLDLRSVSQWKGKLFSLLTTKKKLEN